jgi:hypothetical protein
MTKFLLMTDLDNTLVGDDQALVQLNQVLSPYRQQKQCLLVYSTGRSQERYLQLKAEKSLLEPDALILAVGTQIFQKGCSTPDSTWKETLSQNWDEQLVRQTAAKFAELKPQAQSEQNEFKASYFLAAEAAEQVIPNLRSMLQEQELEVQFVYSSGQDFDILPRRGNKGSAMIFLRHALGMEKEETIVCGDSGNDIAMFAVDESLGVIVGNAQPELLEWYHQHSSPHRYLAKAHCAGGILEGLRHFGFVD